jgi:hypothetical protein
MASVKSLPPTKGFVQLGHDVEAIIGSAYPSFGFGGRNSVGHQFLTSAFSYKFNFSSGQTVGQFPNCTKPRTLCVTFNEHFNYHKIYFR